MTFNYSKPQFVVFPTRTDIYRWRIVGLETNRTVSRYKNLAEAIRVCENLNDRNQQIPQRSENNGNRSEYTV